MSKNNPVYIIPKNPKTKEDYYKLHYELWSDIVENNYPCFDQAYCYSFMVHGVESNSISGYHKAPRIVFDTVNAIFKCWLKAKTPIARRHWANEILKAWPMPESLKPVREKCKYTKKKKADILPPNIKAVEEPAKPKMTLNSRFTDHLFQKNDEVWSPEYGNGIVHHVSKSHPQNPELTKMDVRFDNHPLVQFNYFIDGRRGTGQLPCLFYKGTYIREALSPRMTRFKASETVFHPEHGIGQIMKVSYLEEKGIAVYFAKSVGHIFLSPKEAHEQLYTEEQLQKELGNNGKAKK